MQKFKLKAASVSCQRYAVADKTKAVTQIYRAQGYDYDPTIDYLWIGWSSKLYALARIVMELDEDYTHLMFTDSADVVALAKPEQVMERYFALGHPWVYNAEPFIWSPGSFEPEDYPTPPDAIYRYLNSGASIGEVGHIRAWFDKWTIPASLPRGDQDWVAARYIEHHPDAIKLDVGCELFQCMCGSQVGEDPYVSLDRGVAYNRMTDTYPLVLHFNGGDNICKEETRKLWEHLL